jgi:hypothetical protein
MLTIPIFSYPTFLFVLPYEDGANGQATNLAENECIVSSLSSANIVHIFQLQRLFLEAFGRKIPKKT